MNPSPPKRPTPIFFWKAMPIEMPLAAQRNESFWQIELASHLLEVHGEDAPGEGGGEGDLLPRPALRGEDGHEEALAGEDALARAEERSHEALRLVLAAAVAEDRLHLDAGGHVHERAGLGHDTLARVELDLDELQVLPLDPVVDLLGVRHGGRRVRGGGGNRRGCGGRQVGLELRHVPQRRPALHPRDEDERRGVGAAAPDGVDDVLLGDGADLLAPDGHVPLRRCGHPRLLLQVPCVISRWARGWRWPRRCGRRPPPRCGRPWPRPGRGGARAARGRCAPRRSPPRRRGRW